jgi:hypothetical protein
MPILLYKPWLYLGDQELIKESDTYLIKDIMFIILKCLSGLCAHVDKPDEFNELF